MLYRLRLPWWLAREPHFSEPIVVFQSDDWGQACADNQAAFLRAAPDTLAPGAPAWLTDARESEADVQALADVLASFEDRTGHPACFTLNCIVEQPDYEAIAAAGFSAYASRPVEPVPALLKAAHAGPGAAVFEPQLHGGEHVAPARWLHLLRARTQDLQRFFDLRVMPPPGVIARYAGLGAAYLPCPEEPARSGEALPHVRRLTRALRTFSSVFGRASRGFVAPNHAWDAAVETALADAGVRYLQACHVHYTSWSGAQDGQWTPHRCGPARGADLWYQTRSVDFEPAVRPGDCDAAISLACLLVRRGIPVVINTHRINYVGLLHPARAAYARERLAQLLGALVSTNPGLRFMGSDEFDRVLRGQHPKILRRRAAPVFLLAADLLRAAVGEQPCAGT